MLITNFNDIEIVKQIIQPIIKKYNTVILNDIMESYDAPTERREEILIELFPINPINYKNKKEVDTKYISDCYNIKKEISKIFQNNIADGIDETNNWAFIYIIL